LQVVLVPSNLTLMVDLLVIMFIFLSLRTTSLT